MREAGIWGHRVALVLGPAQVSSHSHSHLGSTPPPAGLTWKHAAGVCAAPPEPGESGARCANENQCSFRVGLCRRSSDPPARCLGEPIPTKAGELRAGVRGLRDL